MIIWPAVHCSFYIAANQNTIRLWLWEGNLNEAWVSWQASRLRSVTTTLAFSLANTWCVSQSQCNLTYSQEVQNRGKLYAALKPNQQRRVNDKPGRRHAQCPCPLLWRVQVYQSTPWLGIWQARHQEEVLHWSPKYSATKKRQYPLFRIVICRKVEN